MKTYVFFFLLSYITATMCIAGIRNGYSDLEGARSSLLSLRKLLEKGEDLPFTEHQSIKKKIEALEHYIIYHVLTERLLEIFQSISSGLYAEIDTLKDHMGRNVDVYVKFVPEKNLPAGIAGITNLDHDKKDLHAYVSEYGPNSVSVTIAAGNNSLSVLAHEFGHVQYQVPNLATYFRYYTKAYLNYSRNRKSIGHNDRDESGKRASHFETRFQGHYLNYIRTKNIKPDTPLSMVQEIQETLKSSGVI